MIAVVTAAAKFEQQQQPFEMRTLYKHISRSHLRLTEMYFVAFAVPNGGDVHFIRIYAVETRETFCF